MKHIFIRFEVKNEVMFGKVNKHCKLYVHTIYMLAILPKMSGKS